MLVPYFRQHNPGSFDPPLRRPKKLSGLQIGAHNWIATPRRRDLPSSTHELTARFTLRHFRSLAKGRIGFLLWTL